MKDFFNYDERIIIKEAIEDHRASNSKVPRNIYGKVLSTADRETSLDEFLTRCFYYLKKHNPNYTLDQMIISSYNHTKEKYGYNGYAKSYIKDLEYDDFLNEVNNILKDKEEFKKRFLQANKIIIRKK